ncbi:MAG: hypothetical protein PHP45_04845 [Elusimicrobiales bacterium]|nr:hypothetical protein [Elusimicrobiales bacterium]
MERVDKKLLVLLGKAFTVLAWLAGLIALLRIGYGWWIWNQHIYAKFDIGTTIWDTLPRLVYGCIDCCGLFLMAQVCWWLLESTHAETGH